MAIIRTTAMVAILIMAATAVMATVMAVTVMAITATMSWPTTRINQS